jgi:hypothetical protein
MNRRSEQSYGVWRTPVEKEKGGRGGWELGRRPRGTGKGVPGGQQRHRTGGRGDGL